MIPQNFTINNFIKSNGQNSGQHILNNLLEQHVRSRHFKKENRWSGILPSITFCQENKQVCRFGSSCLQTLIFMSDGIDEATLVWFQRVFQQVFSIVCSSVDICGVVERDNVSKSNQLFLIWSTSFSALPHSELLRIRQGISRLH